MRISPSFAAALPMTQKRNNTASVPTFAGQDKPAPIWANQLSMPSANGYQHNPEKDLVNMVYQYGNPKADKADRDRVGFRISKHFDPKGKDTAITYENLFDDMQRMGAAYRKKGIRPGDRVSIAETNSQGFLSSYLGALNVGAAVVSLNLLSLQDESRSSEMLMHMINGTESDAFVIGSDSLFAKMAKFPLLQGIKASVEKKAALEAKAAEGGKPGKLKRAERLRAALGPMAERFATGQPARNLREKLVHRILAKSSKTEQDKKNLLYMLKHLDNDIKIITPKEKTRLMHKEMLHPSESVLHPPKDSLAEIIFTSGTTGAPKGVPISHEAMAFTVDSLTKATEGLLGKDDKVLLGLPAFHIFGKATMLTALSQQSEVVLLPSLKTALENLDKVIDTIRDYNITVLPAVPFFLDKLVQHIEKQPADKKAEAYEAMKNIRTVVSGGSKLGGETFAALKRINPDMRIVEGYGSSEGGINTINKSDVPGLIGEPAPGVKVKLMKDGYIDLYGPGEIWVKYPGMPTHYVAGTTKTGKAEPITDDGGWYRTGDKGARTADHQFKIVGRFSNFIKIAGERRDPVEIEEALKAVTPGANEVLAFAHNAATENEKAVAVVVTEDPNVTEASVKSAMAEAARKDGGGWKIPAHVVVIQGKELPPGFDGFKGKDTQYGTVKEFVKKALDRGLVTFHERTGGEREKTSYPDGTGEGLQEFARKFRPGI